MSRRMIGQRPPTINIISSTTYLSSKRVTRSEMVKKNTFLFWAMAENYTDAQNAYVSSGWLKRNTSYFHQWQSLYPPRRI